MNSNNKTRILVLTGLMAQAICTAVVAETMEQKDFAPPATAEVKDIIVEQQDIYTISPGSIDSQATNTMQSAVKVWVNHQNNSYRIGDKIIIHAKAKRDGYLTLLDVGTSGKIRQLFPNKHQSNNYLKKGDIIQIPAAKANFHYRVTGPTGTELIKAIMTKNQGSIYGKSAGTFNDDIFPLTTVKSQALRKDIITELNANHQGNWGEYHKVIRIVSASTQDRHDNKPSSPQIELSNAIQSEQALKLNRAQLRDIQRHLRQAGYYNGSIDGVIGQRTRQAIAAWQKSANLTQSGYLDAATFTHLMSR